MRTNFAEMSGNRILPGSRDTKFKGDAVVRVSRFEEEAIEIGNS
jgi:hypothetical protein